MGNFVSRNGLLYDPSSGAVVGFVDRNGREQPGVGGSSLTAWSGLNSLTGSPSDATALAAALASPTTAASLSADKTLAAADDNKNFTATATSTWVVTITGAVAGFNFAYFIPPAVGSITLRFAGGATHDAGSATDIIINATNAANGVTLVSLGGSAYGVVGLGATDATGFALQSDYLAGGGHRAFGAKKTANYTLAATDKGSVIWHNAASTFALRVAAGLGADFMCWAWAQGASSLWTVTAVVGPPTPSFVSIGGTSATNKTIPSGGLVQIVATGDGAETFLLIPYGNVPMTA